MGQVMKKPQEEQQNSMSEYEDLTLFADESFDTGDVDLFEFSSEDDSILTRLKSIILSLDWEINDETLEELSQELQALKGEWQDDKVAEVYLQGLDKIGRYIRSKGAYAHPNSIKLLLTFYYNFEKITSSDSLSEEEIAMMLKGDIRKFKILQYQINQEGESAMAAATSPQAPILLQPAVEERAAVSPEEEDHLKLLKASILSLDWEVTEESLNQFNQQVDHFHQRLADDKPAMVLVQGLRALGDYIEESAATAHPESFTLLHAFSEGLEQVLHVEPDARDKEQLQTLLIDRVSRLNALKELIVEEPAAPTEEIVDELVEEMQAVDEAPVSEQPFATTAAPVTHEERAAGSMDIEAELDDLFPEEVHHSPAMETSEKKYPDEVVPPEAIQPISDEIADGYIETQLRSKRDLAPALSGMDEIVGFNEDSESFGDPAQSDLNDQLDKLFSDDVFGEKAADEATSAQGDDVIPALADAPSLEEALADFTPADKPKISPPETETSEEMAFDIESKLDTFFSEEDDAPAETAEEVDAESVDDGLAPALSGSEDEQGFTIDESLETSEDSPLSDIEEKLDFFFGEGDEETSLMENSMTDIGEDFEEPIDFFAEKDNQREALDQALGMTGGSPAPAQSHQDSEQEKELEEKLDFFFDASEDDEEEPALELEDAFPMQPPAAERTPEAAAVPESVLPAEEEKEIRLAALGAVLPQTVRTPTDALIAETGGLIAELKAVLADDADQITAQLLETIVKQLVHSRCIDLDATEKVINALFGRLRPAASEHADFAEVMQKYLQWQNGVVQALADAGAAPLLPSAAPGKTTPPEAAAETADKTADLQLIRNIIKEEFNQLRDALKSQN